jgi:hypothetical protein
MPGVPGAQSQVLVNLVLSNYNALMKDTLIKFVYFMEQKATCVMDENKGCQ